MGPMCCTLQSGQAVSPLRPCPYWRQRPNHAEHLIPDPTRTLPILSPEQLLYSHYAGRVRTRVHMEDEPQRGLRDRSQAAQEEADSDDEAELLRMQVPTYAVSDRLHEIRLSGRRQYCVKPLHLLLIKRRCADTLATHRSAVPCLYNIDIHTICHSCRTSSCRGSNSQQQG